MKNVSLFSKNTICGGLLQVFDGFTVPQVSGLPVSIRKEKAYVMKK